MGCACICVWWEREYEKEAKCSEENEEVVSSIC
jgi:hypothetical protein